MFAVFAKGLFQIQPVIGPSGFDVAQKKARKFHGGLIE